MQEETLEFYKNQPVNNIILNKDSEISDFNGSASS